MKKASIVVAVVLATCLGTGLMGAMGCSSVDSSNSSSSGSVVSSKHLAPAVGKGHEARMENLNKLGPNACYGCHGSNDQANPMLAGIAAMPDNHYLNEDPSTHELDPSRNLCNTCHVPGADDE